MLILWEFFSPGCNFSPFAKVTLSCNYTIEALACFYCTIFQIVYAVLTHRGDTILVRKFIQISGGINELESLWALDLSGNFIST